MHCMQLPGTSVAAAAAAPAIYVLNKERTKFVFVVHSKFLFFYLSFCFCLFFSAHDSVCSACIRQIVACTKYMRDGKDCCSTHSKRKKSSDFVCAENCRGFTPQTKTEQNKGDAMILMIRHHLYCINHLYNNLLLFFFFC